MRSTSTSPTYGPNRRRNHRLVQERTIYHYNRVNEILEPLQPQFLYSRSIGYVTGDNPLVIADRNYFRVGVRDKIAIGDAEHF